MSCIGIAGMYLSCRRLYTLKTLRLLSVYQTFPVGHCRGSGIKLPLSKSQFSQLTTSHLRPLDTQPSSTTCQMFKSIQLQDQPQQNPKTACESLHPEYSEGSRPTGREDEGMDEWMEVEMEGLTIDHVV